MKTSFKTLLLAGALATTSFAGNYGMAGCGIGSMVIGDKGKGSQLAAAFIDDAFFLGGTGGALGSIASIVASVKTFAVSSGTSNCEDAGVASVETEKEFFVSTNYNSLVQEMAQGSGDNLEAFATLMGCDGSSVQVFSSAVQTNFDTVVGEAEGSSELLTNVNTMVTNDQDLATSCDVI